MEDSADRLEALVANLLATSRLEAGALSVVLTAVDVEEIVGRGISTLPQQERVVVDVPERLPLVLADLGLAERVVANLVDNALRHSGNGTNVLVTAAERGQEVVLSVVDSGPGVLPSRRKRCSPPTSGWATARRVAWDSACPSPAASPGRWAGRSRPRRPSVEA